MDKDEQKVDPQAEEMKQFRLEEQAVLDKYKMYPEASIDFPMYKQLPPEVQLALVIIEKHNPTWVITYKKKE